MADSHCTDLAVIFRPALIAHPSHELSPQEHQLSQDVLEFLIKHQDWFMLDIPTPPISRPMPDGAAAVPTTDTTADLLVSSDEESGGWKLISRDVPKSIGRRRTTTERSAGESSLQAFAAARTPSKVPARARARLGLTPLPLALTYTRARASAPPLRQRQRRATTGTTTRRSRRSSSRRRRARTRS